jgi:hypothetical protein
MKEKLLAELMARKAKIQEDYSFIFGKETYGLHYSNALSVIDGRKKEITEIISFIEGL